ncbi:MAG: hypothetical protein ACLQNE_22760 [Thermoguttaceae bacterium]
MRNLDDILFCCDPGRPRTVDEAYQRDAKAAAEVGIEYDLFDYEALVNESDAARAVRRVPTARKGAFTSSSPSSSSPA